MKKLSDRLKDLTQEAVDKAIEKHRLRGESIPISDEQGNVKVVSASEISEITKITMTNKNYPFAQELITDTQGNIRKVILNFEDYQNLLENLEDKALYQAMKETFSETPLNREEALKALEEE